MEAGSSELPEDFPKDVAIPDEAEIVSTLKISSDDGSGYFVTFNLKMNAKDAADFYRKSLKEQGLELSELAATATSA